MYIRKNIITLNTKLLKSRYFLMFFNSPNFISNLNGAIFFLKLQVISVKGNVKRAKVFYILSENHTWRK